MCREERRKRICRNRTNCGRGTLIHPRAVKVKENYKAVNTVTSVGSMGLKEILKEVCEMPKRLSYLMCTAERMGFGGGAKEHKTQR